MSVSPKNNIEGAKTDITVMAIEPITNQKGKNQKNGDATKVKSSGELQIANGQTPVIDANFVRYVVGLDGKRQLPSGKIMQANVTNVPKNRRGLQKAIISEQEKDRQNEMGR